MKKVSIFLIGIMTITAAGANPMFCDGCRRSVSLSVAQGTGRGSLLKLIDPFDWAGASMTNIMAQYSVPMTIFDLDARMNASVMQNTAYASEHGLSFFGVGISWDVASEIYDGWYVGFGIGPYYRNNYDRWVSSRLVFGEKFFIGKNIGENLRAEIFTLHFSNGDFTPVNRGINFAGVSVSYGF